MKYRVPEHLAWVDGEDIGVDAGVYLVDVREGTPLVLRGSAQVIWSVAADGGELPDDVPVPDGADPDEVHAQAHAFVLHLVSLGLLERDA